MAQVADGRTVKTARSTRADTIPVKGGDKSRRAAVSGATGERSTSGGANKPEPKDQDEKAQASPRNRTRRKPN